MIEVIDKLYKEVKDHGISVAHIIGLNNIIQHVESEVDALQLLERVYVYREGMVLSRQYANADL